MECGKQEQFGDGTELRFTVSGSFECRREASMEESIQAKLKGFICRRKVYAFGRCISFTGHLDI